MYGKKRHEERRKAAKEKERVKWELNMCEEREYDEAVDLVKELASKGVDVPNELEKMGMDTYLGPNFDIKKFLPALKELAERSRRG